MDVNKEEHSNSILQSRKAYLRQFISILTGCILIIDVGAHFGWSSPALPHLTSEKSKFSVTIVQGAWLTSVVSLSAVIGCMINSFIIDRIGRRYTILIFGVLHLMTWMLINLAYNYTFLFIARFASGFCLGGTFSFLPLYIGEVTDKKIRGAYLAFDRICINLGIFLINTLGAFLPYETMNLVMIALPTIAICLFPFMLETPYFYLMQGREEEAIKILMKLTRAKKPEMVMGDIERMKKAMENQNSENSSIGEFISDRGSRKALIIILLAYITYAFSGTIVIQAYSQDIFKQTGSSVTPKHAAMIIAGIQIFSGLLSTQLIDYWGRRPVYMFSGIMSAMSLGTVGLFCFFKDYLQTDVSSVAWLPLVGLALYQFMCNSGISTIPTVLLGELFSVKVKGAAMIMASIFMALFMFTSKMVLPLLKNSSGLYTAFWIFSCVCFIGPIIIINITPETKGKTLEEILIVMNENKR